MELSERTSKIKILVISLLRMGDIVMQTGALRALRHKYPHSEIHLLVNSECFKITKLIDCIDDIKVFDRRLLQGALVDPQRPIFEAYDRLKYIIEDLRSERYDITINLTHNKISGYLMGQLSAKESFGLQIEEQTRVGNVWFQLLNDFGLTKWGTPFHYADLFCLGIDAPIEPSHVAVTKGASAEVLTLTKNHSSYISLQLFTSDAKKNLSVDQWLELLKSFRLLQPKTGIFLLLGPGEMKNLKKHLKELSQLQVELVECDFETAISIINGSELLVTTDTVMKHLSSAVNTQVVELSVGSSHWNNTGAYLNNSYIFQTRVSCAPCAHSSPCHQSSHLCAEQVPADLIGLFVGKMIDKDFPGLKLLGKEIQRFMDLYQVDTSTLGYWMALPMHMSETSISRLVIQLAWKLHLDGESQFRLNSIHSQSLLLADRINEIAPLADALDVYERDLDRSIAKISVFKNDLIRSVKDTTQLSYLYQSIARWGESLQKHSARWDIFYLSQYLMEFKYAPEFHQLRAVKYFIHELQSRLEIEKKICRNINEVNRKPKLERPVWTI